MTYGAKLSDAMLYLEKMFPTPRARDHFPPVNPNQVQRNEQGWTSTRKKTGVRYGATLPDVMNKLEVEKKLYNTPTANDAKNLTFPKSQTDRTSVVGNLIQQKQSKPGGKLNPNFVEFLMGYPMNWTKIDQAE